MNEDIFLNLLHDLKLLDAKKISYSLNHYREEAIMVSIAIPGERWEIEYLNDGSIEIEKFKSDGKIYSKEEMNRILK